MDQWKGKVALITGVSSGIGEAIARELVKHGMKVAGLARRSERVQTISKDLESCPGTLHPIKCDVTKDEEIKAAFAWIENNWGPVHVVINNAGVFNLLSISCGNEAVERMMKTNVIGAMGCMREGVTAMKRHKVDGVIININSAAGHVILNLPGVGPYSATKHCLRALSDYLRNEVAQLDEINIRVTNLSPGVVESEMSAQFMDRMPPATPILKAKDIADCVVFVLSAPPRMNVDELKVRPTKSTESSFTPASR